MKTSGDDKPLETALDKIANQEKRAVLADAGLEGHDDHVEAELATVKQRRERMGAMPPSLEEARETFLSERRL